MTTTEQRVYEEHLALARHCQEKARDAIHKESPKAASEWLRAAEHATQAAAAIRSDVPR